MSGHAPGSRPTLTTREVLICARLAEGVQDAAHASVPAHPGVARLLARCDEREANMDGRLTYGGNGLLPAQITTAEVRALLAGGEQS